MLVYSIEDLCTNRCLQYMYMHVCTVYVHVHVLVWSQTEWQVFDSVPPVSKCACIQTGVWSKLTLRVYTFLF